MVKRWPGCFIPPLPSKKVLGNTETNFMLERKKYLHNFCNRVQTHGFLYYSIEFQIFLRQKDSDINKKYQRYQIQIQKYNFIIINKKDQLQTVQQLNENKQKTNQYLNKFCQQTIQTYEKRILSEYTLDQKNTMIFLDEQNQKLSQSIENIVKINIFFFINKIIKLKFIFIKQSITETNNFKLLCDFVNYELQDTEAFIKAFEFKDEFCNRLKKLETILKEKVQYLSELQSGQKTLRQLFTKGDAEQQMKVLSSDIYNLLQRLKNTKNKNKKIL
ncbi:PX domain protein [Ichthyophthirius multifiliis]|uniref:PX domain protein n=1 Tax=Ichthyophthirius multifiliis TaxID=5932 RepID=G0QPM4_ICHMU|nr:PX domain protein [Ichthyophthirius multifiliis]EGR32824.1 PX domain protein [Ichthyophthirius multifiliis]|eukprot:XP_004036810.1 PX domain protein [Ichthyophthirius multifiliis]